MNVYLTPEHEDLINEKVAGGLYDSPSDVVREGLQLLHEQDQLRELRRENLRKEIQKGIDDIRAGRYRTYESGDDLAAEIIREGSKRLEQKRLAQIDELKEKICKAKC